MKKVILFFGILLGLSGCSSFRNTPWVAYFYQTNKMVESLCPGKGHSYSIYEYSSPFVGVTDNEKHFPAHYQILLPPQTGIKKMYERSDNRCFVYSKSRGIAIIQEIYSWRKEYENGLSEISMDEAEGLLAKVVDITKIKVKDNRHHYLYVDNEIRIVMFNLSENDYHDFVEFPLENLKFRRRGEIRWGDEDTGEKN